ncbi:MAG TPA: GNAT family N-acetyltransferase [Ktedonobacterales bacterium]|jgi:GNAT superfamily N-acetyltransferase
MIQEWRRGEYTVSTDKQRVDLDVVHSYLSSAYWCEGIPREIVQRSIEHSLVFGVYKGAEQVGFARIISDLATFAYLGDVFILEAYRGQGLSVWLMECIVAHPDLQGLRRWTLFTRDAHGLYEKVGFKRATTAERLMERAFPTIYKEAHGHANDQS